MKRFLYLLNFQYPTVSAVGLPYTSLPLDGGGDISGYPAVSAAERFIVTNVR